MGKLCFHPGADVIRLYVVVEGLQGKTRTLRMIFDPGSAYVVIPPEAAEALGFDLECGGTGRRQVVSAHRVQEVPLVIARSIAALGHRISDVEMVCLDLPPQLRAEGLLGNSFLRHFKVTLDYGEGVLEIMPIHDSMA